MDEYFQTSLTEIQERMAMSEGFDIYQAKAYPYRAWPHTDVGSLYPVLALAEETGEAIGKIAKAIRKDVEVDTEALKKELGDVLWNLSAFAYGYGISLGDIALTNLEKLQDRKERNVLIGEGDDR
jgi:NTP pyrophosphatase (non-canonical NTP hydrolase)